MSNRARKLLSTGCVAAALSVPAIGSSAHAAALSWPCGGSCPSGEHIVQTVRSPYGGYYALTNWGGIWGSGGVTPVYGLVSYLGYAATTPNPPLERALHGNFAYGGLHVTSTSYTLTNTRGESYGFTGPVIDNLKAARIAESQIGILNPSYSAGGFWCAQFVSWVEAQAGTLGYRYESSPGWLEGDAKAEGRYTTTPHVGDVAFIDLFGQNGIGNNGATHVGIVVAVNGTEVVTVEGNAASGPNTVTVHSRRVDDGYLFGFGRW